MMPVGGRGGKLLEEVNCSSTSAVALHLIDLVICPGQASDPKNPNEC